MKRGATPRAARLFDVTATEDGPRRSGFLYARPDEPWAAPTDRLSPRTGSRPGDAPRVKYHLRDLSRERPRRSRRPRRAGDGMARALRPAPFRFCLRCGVAYRGRSAPTSRKLATLGSDGRSTATTILASSDRPAPALATRASSPAARKLLAFTDNRQDASLQAGHFNDFVEVGLLRSALYRAAAEGWRRPGSRHDELTQRVFEALTLPARLSTPATRR